MYGKESKMASLDRRLGVHNLTPSSYLQEELDTQNSKIQDIKVPSTTSTNPDFGTTNTIYMRPQVGYVERNNGKVKDQPPAKNRIATPYPQIHHQIRPKASHGCRDGRSSSHGGRDGRSSSHGSSRDSSQNMRSQPYEFSKEMSKTMDRNVTATASLSTGTKSNNESCSSNILKITPLEILKMAQSGREMIKQTLSDNPFQQRALDLYDCGETSRKEIDKVGKDKGKSVDHIDYWRSDEDADDEREEGDWQELDKLEAMIYDQIDKEENQYTDDKETISNCSSNSSASSISDPDSIQIIERKLPTERIRQISFERKYGLPYQSFVLPPVLRKSYKSTESGKGNARPQSPGVDELLKTLGWDTPGEKQASDSTLQDRENNPDSEQNQDNSQNNGHDLYEGTTSLVSIHVPTDTQSIGSYSAHSLQIVPRAGLLHQEAINTDEEGSGRIHEKLSIKSLWNKMKAFLTGKGKTRHTRKTPSTAVANLSVVKTTKDQDHNQKNMLGKIRHHVLKASAL